MNDDRAAARLVFERWSRTERFRGLPLPLAHATWVLHDQGDEDISLDDVAPLIRPFVQAAWDFQKALPWDPTRWQELLAGAEQEDVQVLAVKGSLLVPDMMTIVPAPDARIQVVTFCEPLLARLDARGAWKVMHTVISDAELLGFGTIGRFLAIQWRLQNPGDDWIDHLGRRPAPALREVIAANLACLDAVSPEPDIRTAVQQAILGMSHKQVRSLPSDAVAAYLAALALVDPEAALARLHDQRTPWSAVMGVDAMARVAHWMAREHRSDLALDRLQPEKPLIISCEWLCAVSGAGAVTRDVVERIALSFVPLIAGQLESSAWLHAVQPLCQAAACIGSIAIIEAVCRELVPPGDVVIAGLVEANLSRLRREHPAQTSTFLEDLATSPAFAATAWATEEAPLVASFELGMAVVRVAAASPIGLEVWNPLSDVFALADRQDRGETSATPGGPS